MARKRAGMAPVDVASALELEWNLKINQADISEIERHARMVRDIELKTLAAVLNVESRSLLDWTGEAVTLTSG
ncbi:XRE family transcriptional regulator [Acuticoccus sediminis]|uniref:XRE family transcriptional regulator n=1 Tax=Acuticoccus sediminis TaxID=2184697 RepID=A0A8B2NL65_9HYPH|nr:XRE family transcriptional regulator [Acuticoccus sediminis]RAH95676.1 XRE family transcriptional regulator [Acuticoccus sediminis]